MTLREALAHIETAEDCGLKAAWDQLRDAIGDREAAVRWADVSLDLSTIGGGHYIEEDDVPPSEKWFWKSAWVKFKGEGRVLDDSVRRGKDVRLKLIREGKLSYRPLLVLREHVEKNWSIANGTAEPQRPTADLTDNTEKLHKPSADAPKPSIAQIREFAKQVYADPAHNKPNENDFWDLIKVTLPGASRVLVRQIIKEPEFKSQRRLPGRQPKK
jgi:hypothetical protein